MPIPFFAAVGAFAAVGILAAVAFNSLSDEERKRQNELDENYREYQSEAVKKNEAAHERYYRELHSMEHASAEKLYAMRERLIREKKQSNQHAYNTVVECLKQQEEDADQKIAYCKELMAQLKQHTSQQQYTPMRQQSVKSARKTLIEFMQEERAYMGYLQKYRGQLERTFERTGELIPPFSMRLPEKVPYTNQVIVIDKSDLNGDNFDICVDSGAHIYYKAVCDDPENTALFPGADSLYCLVTRNEKGEYGSVKHLSCAKGMFIQQVVRQPKVGIDAVVSKIEQQEEKHRIIYYLAYQGVTLRLFPKDCIERRYPVIGEHRRVYVKYWDYKMGVAQVTEQYEDSLKIENFSTIPLVFHKNQSSEFTAQVEKLGLDESMDDWYVGPCDSQWDQLKLQLGNKAAFQVHVSLPSPEEDTCYFEFSDFLPKEDMFQFNDVFVAFDAKLDAMPYQKKNIKACTENTEDLLIYLEKQFAEQNKIKNSQANILYFNQWSEVMKRLIDIKTYGRLSCKDVRILEIEEDGKTLLIFPEDTGKVQNFLNRLSKKHFSLGNLLVQLHNGRSLAGTSDMNGEELFLQTRITVEEAAAAAYTVDLYEETIPYPEIQQQQALEAFRLGQMTNAKLKGIIFDLPHLTFSDSQRRIGRVYNPSVLHNESQLNALTRATAVDDFFLIQGPPGSGKTTLIKEMIYQQLAADPQSRILIVSQANVAVDNVLRGLTNQNALQPEQIVRCGNLDTISSDLQEYYFEKRLEQYEKRVTQEDCPEALLPYRKRWIQLLSEKDNKVQISEYLLNNFSVIGATCVGLAKKKIGLNRIDFDLVIVDEAGKALPGELLIPVNHAKKIIIIGDHKQLPPVVDPVLFNGGVQLDDIIDEDTINEFFSTSFFQYLFEQCPADNKCMLTMQFRMPNVIGNLVSQLFYDGKLESAPNCAHKQPLLFSHHMIFLNMDGDAAYREKKDSPQSSPYNEREVIVVYHLVKRIREKYDGRLVVITPYKRQKSKLKQALKAEKNVVINTIDAFQGDEADIVIYCMTRSQHKTAYFSDNARLNVAMSRTKNTLIFVGSMSYLYNYGETHNLGKIASYIEQNGIVLTYAEIMNPNRDWQWNLLTDSPTREEPHEVCNGTSEDIAVSGLDKFLPQKKSEETSDTAECRICHKAYAKEELEEGICPDCLYDGEVYECKKCRKPMLYTNKRRYIEKLPREEYCEDCKIVKEYPCQGCGEIIRITNKQFHEHKLPKYCYQCHTAVVQTVRCKSCGKEISLTQEMVDQMAKGERRMPEFCHDCNQLVVVGRCGLCNKEIKVKRGKINSRTNYNLCYECSHKVYKREICENCFNPFDITYGEKAYFESKGFDLPKRCKDCRRKRKANNNTLK